MSTLKIIYQDDDLLVLDKPPHLVTEDALTVTGDSVTGILQRDFHINLLRGGLVHRLDKDTSGVLLVAKSQAALEDLQSQFKQRLTQKQYLALVHGFIDQAGTIKTAIIRNPQNREKFTTALEGKEATTEYEPLGNFQFTIYNFQSIFNDLNKIQMRKLERMRYNQFTFLQCFPKTGRTHQIRVHLKYIGHPIVADEKYAGRKMCRLDNRWCPRQFLHAQRIGFKHPATGKWMEVESKLPMDLKKVLDKFND